MTPSRKYVLIAQYSGSVVARDAITTSRRITALINARKTSPKTTAGTWSWAAVPVAVVTLPRMAGAASTAARKTNKGKRAGDARPRPIAGDERQHHDERELRRQQRREAVRGTRGGRHGPRV